MSIEMKSVIVIDETLPLGILANTSAILGMTMGKVLPQLVGEDVRDASGEVHRGVISLPLPILKGNGKIKEILEKLKQDAFQDLMVVDFTKQAQSCKVYEEYIQLMKDTNQEDLSYMGIALYGTKKQINALTGSMPLLR